MNKMIVAIAVSICIFCPVSFAGITFVPKVGNGTVAVRTETVPDKVTEITLLDVDDEIARADANITFYQNSLNDWETKKTELMEQRIQMLSIGIKGKIPVLPSQ